jgi:hypothetical protein
MVRRCIRHPQKSHLQLLALAAQAQQINIGSIDGQHDRIQWKTLNTRMEPFGLFVHHIVDANLALVVIVECDLQA